MRANPKLHTADKESRRCGRIERNVGDVVARRAGLDEPVDPTDQVDVLFRTTHQECRGKLERRVLLPVLIRILGSPTQPACLVTDKRLEGRSVRRPGKFFIIGVEIDGPAGRRLPGQSAHVFRTVAGLVAEAETGAQNTMAAFERGIADGADWLELDVQEDADGVVVVEHDRDFIRAAGAGLEVWQATRDDLANLDIGSSFAPEFSDQRIPTPREVLELARGKAGVFIELKYYRHDVNLEEKVVELVEETGMTDHVVFMSLNYDGVRKTAALRPDWTYGLLNAVAIGDLTRLDVDLLALTAKTTTVPMIRRTHRRGMKTYPWTINDPVQMWVMMSRGADGIITDRVALANRVKELRAEVTPVGRFIIWIAGEVGLLRGMDETSSEENA